MSESLCDRCVGLCCRYFALPLDNPTTAADFDNIRWYLCHENVVVFVEDKQWYIGLLNRCKHLLPDNRCGIYEQRPRICRGYSTKNCDYHGDEYQFEHLFTSAEQLRLWAEAHLSRKKGRKVRLVATPPVGKTITLPPVAGESGRTNGNGRAESTSSGAGNGRVRLPVIAGNGSSDAAPSPARLAAAPRVRRRR